MKIASSHQLAAAAPWVNVGGAPRNLPAATLPQKTSGGKA